MFKLVKFSCGCVGTEPVGGQSTIVDACDKDVQDADVSFYNSHRIGGKAFEPLTDLVTETYRIQIERLIYDGYQMKSLRRILNIK